MAVLSSTFIRMFRNFAFKFDFGGFFILPIGIQSSIYMCYMVNAIEIASIVFQAHTQLRNVRIFGLARPFA